MPNRSINVSGEVWDAIAERGKFGETEDDVLRRVFGLDAKTDPLQPTSSKRGRSPRIATNRMSAEVHRRQLIVEFADGRGRQWELPDRSDKAAIRHVRTSAGDFARDCGASQGQINAVFKALTDAGYHLTK